MNYKLQNASILIGQQGVSCSLYWLTKVRQIYEPSSLLFHGQMLVVIVPYEIKL